MPQRWPRVYKLQTGEDLVRTLRDLRRRTKYRQTDIAERVGVSRAAVANWETEVSQPRSTHWRTFSICMARNWSPARGVSQLRLAAICRSDGADRRILGAMGMDALLTEQS